MRIKITGGTLANPAGEKKGLQDILVEDGIIKAIGQNVGEADVVIDASGKTVFPGFIDLHCHLREPGQEHKEDIASGARSAKRIASSALRRLRGVWTARPSRSAVSWTGDFRSAMPRPAGRGGWE